MMKMSQLEKTIQFGRAQNLSVGWRLWRWLMRLDDWEVRLRAEVVVEALWYIRSAKFFSWNDLKDYLLSDTFIRSAKVFS